MNVETVQRFVYQLPWQFLNLKFAFEVSRKAFGFKHGGNVMLELSDNGQHVCLSANNQNISITYEHDKFHTTFLFLYEEGEYNLLRVISNDPEIHAWCETNDIDERTM